jgi:hypothetical protein
MFVPNRKQSNEAIQNALFGYLNLNRHKFDEHGNFDHTPDRRDYVHPLLIVDAKPPKPPKWQIPKGTRVPFPTTRFVAPGKVWRKPSYPPDPTLPRHVNGKPVPLPKINRRYTPEECNDMLQDEIIQCKNEWEGKWPSYAYGKCIGRATDRQNLCLMNGEYNPSSKPYSANDLNDEDQKEYWRRKKKEEGQENVEPAPKPEKEPDKSEFSVGSMFTNALTDTLTNTAKVALALDPGLQFAIDPSGTQSRMNSMLRNFVMLPSDYPKGMQPLSKWSPTPATVAAAGMLPVPFGGAAAIRLPTSFGR